MNSNHTRVNTCGLEHRQQRKSAVRPLASAGFAWLAGGLLFDESLNTDTHLFHVVQ